MVIPGYRIAGCAASTLALPIRSTRSDEREHAVSHRGLRHRTLAATGWSCHGLPTARRSEGKRSGEDSRRMALALTEHWLAAYNTLDLTERGSVFPSAVETFK
ncbi:hypothetical protein PC128_g14271 [Phytophthora cactorum]|nr:hypothetical protein PC120_g14646 [Phytophthora cactorum]KAG3065684.1 hypothetical protein PC121_g11228 [Phytophthora cactorum]KAG3183269.1 hypothetical protein PC128_g14271 [Phytophthora cactorum]KAG4049930.1 hypothetical protein PC123_g14806 [Phytophthora cactorum]